MQAKAVETMQIFSFLNVDESTISVTWMYSNCWWYLSVVMTCMYMEYLLYDMPNLPYFLKCLIWGTFPCSCMASMAIQYACNKNFLCWDNIVKAGSQATQGTRSSSMYEDTRMVRWSRRNRRLSPTARGPGRCHLLSLNARANRN